MSFKKNIGIHLRLTHTLSQLAQDALACGVTSFQFFLIHQKTEKYVTLNTKDKEDFLRLRRNSFTHLFVHSSYWINPAGGSKQNFLLSKNLLKRELRMAQTLEVDYLVLHAGSAKGHPVSEQDPHGKLAGIGTLTKMLNNILKQNYSVKILLENGAHGKRTIGSDFGDFIHIKQRLDYPEKVGFCIDTAHAFSYGYNLDPTDDFIKLVDTCLGLEHIKLIHFNDTYDAHGSMQDRHAFPGKGNIGKKTLQQILHHPQLITIPKIIEGPTQSIQDTIANLEDLYQW